MSDVTKELIKTADQIRRKYRALKRGREVIEDSRIESLKPIVEPLRELVETQKAFKPLPPAIIETPPTPPPLPSITEGFLSPTRTVTIGKIATGYLNHSFKKGNDADHTYGIRYENRAYKIGNKVIKIKNNDIIVGDTPYKGTQGLWELITLKKPKEYTQDDLDTYKAILLQTNGHLKNYIDGAQMSGNKHTKYLNIIKPLFQSTGEGLMAANDNKIEHRYWDDPNELVKRLRLLHLSKRAGNTGVHNEMESIIKELLEREIIFHK